MVAYTIAHLRRYRTARERPSNAKGTRPSIDVHRSFDATLIVLPAIDLGSLSERRIAWVQEVLYDCVDRLRTTHLIVDLEQVPHFGAEFLAILAQLARRLSANHQRLALVGDHPNLCRLAHLDRMFPTFVSKQSALAWCARSNLHSADWLEALDSDPAPALSDCT